MSKSEAEVCFEKIEPALLQAGWDRAKIGREVSYTDGRILVRGKVTARGKRKRADYILYHKKPSIPIAVIEAKKAAKSIASGLQQGLGYAKDLDIPFVFSSNGNGFRFRDKTGLILTDVLEKDLSMDEFPSPQLLWEKYKEYKNLTEEEDGLITYPNHVGMDGKSPRYYQQIAINRTIEAISRGQNRVLLTMATGTGKTFTAFQILWRLWKTRRARRILFLADRNILVDQTMNNDFAPFKGVMKKINRKLIDENGRIDTSHEIYLALYQAIIGGETREDIYTKFPRDFFDLICIDECHRGSASEDSQWRCVLDYFNSATQIGLTATPKETKDTSNSHYFGDPVYTYSLQEGINDGFLAPFKVIRVDLDKDLQGWRPERNQVDDHGKEIEDRIYNQRDYDRNLILTERTKRVAGRVTSFLHNNNVYSKVIIFCEDIDHAERMRMAITNEPRNRKLVLEDERYVMKITGDDQEGKAQLENFIDPMSRYPVIATTSKLMTTGIDAKTCELIVLDRRIQSMIEFKQIIGRGTRLHPDKGKLYFTILDFRKATELFADPDWDGPALQIYEPQEGEDITPQDEDVEIDESEFEEILEDNREVELDQPEDEYEQKKYVVSGVEVSVVAERVQYYGIDGKLIMESLTDYTRKTIQRNYATLDDFIKRWSAENKKSAIIEELMEQGILIESLEEYVGKDKDPFDLICHVAFDQPPLTRKERVENVRKRDVFTKYGEKARKVLEALLDKYADEGIRKIEDTKILRLSPFDSIGTPIEIMRSFSGGKKGFQQAIKELEEELYKQVG